MYSTLHFLTTPTISTPTTSPHPHPHPTHPTKASIMLDSVKLCLLSQLKRGREILEKVISFPRCKKLEKTTSWKLTCDLNWLASSFAAMEASSQLKQVFKLIDTNGDGKLSSSELKQVLLSLGHEREEAAREAEGIVREMDCDGDGYVDLDEFMVVVMGSNCDDDESGICRERVMMAAFKVFDGDGDGLISAEELRSVLARLGCGKKCSVKECRKMIKGVDRDGDGFVNFHEFKLMMTIGY